MKNLLRLFTIGGMALVIAACGGGEEAGTGDDAASEESANSPEEPVTEEAEVEEGNEEEAADSSSDSSEAVEEDVNAETEDEEAASGEEESKTFVYEEEGYINELVYYYTDDRVQRQTAESRMTYEALGVSNEDEARELLDEFSDQYNDVEGVTQEIEYTDEGIIETLEVDYSVASLGDVVALEEESFEEGAESAEYISMERSEEQLLSEGYEVVDE